jgi:hypothetical protein
LSKTPERSRRHRAFFKREWKRQRQALKALAAERESPPAEAERYRPTDAVPVSPEPSEFEALADVISQALGLKEDPRSDKSRKVRKLEPASEPRGAGVADTWSEVTILLAGAQRPKDSTTEKGGARWRRAVAVQKLLSRFRGGDPDRRILHFLREEGLRIVLADNSFKALRLFLGRPGRGHREPPPWRDHDIAVAVKERVARGLTVEQAVEQVATTTKPRLSVSRVRRIYYDHRREAEADLDLRRREKG